jgi:hypothetical protein
MEDSATAFANVCIGTGVIAMIGLVTVSVAFRYTLS